MGLYAEIKETMETKLSYIAQRAAREPEGQFNNIMHLVNKETLKANFYGLGRKRAGGVDGVSWQEYEKDIGENIEGLVGRMKRMGYRPQPVRRVYIPKDKNTKRPLGIPAIEDKIVQKTMTTIMGAIYEKDFKDSSYGFRPKRNCHQALKGVNDLIRNKPINHVIDADIKGFFDNVTQGRLMEMIRKRITDERFLRYIVRFLKAGYKEEGLLRETEKGTPQGGNISPMLANIFLHYVLDKWFEEEIKPKMRGHSYLVRYCDDFVILVQYKEEAEEIMRKLQERFEENELQLHPEKTRVISFGRYERENARRQRRKANTFDFLGFTHYCGVSRNGRFKVGRKTSRKKYRKSLEGMKEWLKAARNTMKIKDWWKLLKIRLYGYYQYYGVSDNFRSIQEYYREVIKLGYKWINRRSQKRSYSWEQYNQYLKRFPLPRPRIVHRFYVPLQIG